MPKNDIEAMKDAKHLLKERNCSELSYRITVLKDVFDVQRFVQAIGASTPSNGWNTVRRIPRDSALADYHIHVYWKADDEPSKLKLQVDFHAWPPEWQEEQSPPFAEEFFQWVQQFLSVEALNAHIHAELEFPSERWHSKIMALPIKLPYGEKTAVIEGLAIHLPSEPEGVSNVWIHRDKRSLSVQLFADRSLVLKTFSPCDDVDAFVSVAKSLLEEKSL